MLGNGGFLHLAAGRSGGLFAALEPPELDRVHHPDFREVPDLAKVGQGAGGPANPATTVAGFAVSVIATTDLRTSSPGPIDAARARYRSAFRSPPVARYRDTANSKRVRS